MNTVQEQNDGNMLVALTEKEIGEVIFCLNKMGDFSRHRWFELKETGASAQVLETQKRATDFYNGLAHRLATDPMNLNKNEQ